MRRLPHLTRPFLPIALLSLTLAAPAFAADPAPGTSVPSGPALLLPASCLVLAPSGSVGTSMPLSGTYVLQACAPTPLDSKASMVHPTAVPDALPVLCATPLQAEVLTLGQLALDQDLDMLPPETLKEAFGNIAGWFGKLPKTLEGR